MKVRIGIIADYNAKSPYHTSTEQALLHSGNRLELDVEPVWIPTESLDSAAGLSRLRDFHALFCGPGSPYKSMNGAIDAIRFARENNWPFIGT